MTKLKALVFDLDGTLVDQEGAERDALQALLKERQIGSGVLYPVPVHKQPAYLDNILIGPGGLALTELVAGEILSLPVHPGVCRNDATRVVESIKEAIKLLPNI